MINKRKAIIYIGFGELYVVMALLSIKTLRKIDKETKVYLITNINFDPINIEYWNKDRDKILYFPDESNNNREYKTSLNKYIDEEKVVFFDCDTLILSKFDIAWSYLDYFDIALKMNPVKQKKIGKGDVSILNNKYLIRDIPHFNSGVIFFKKSDLIDEFFKLWNQFYKKNNIKYDQVGLMESLFLSKLRILPLTEEWNFFPDINFFKGKVKKPIILHYTNRISYVIENELLKIARLTKLDLCEIKNKINKKRSERKLKIGRLEWFKLRLIWKFLYKTEQKRLNLS